MLANPHSSADKQNKRGTRARLRSDVEQVMGEGSEFASAAAWAATNLTFDIDRRVHTFELTIRALGGLLSAHVLVAANPGLLPGAFAAARTLAALS